MQNILNLTKHEKTKNILFRALGNVSGSISTFFLIRVIRCENKNHMGRAIFYNKLFKVFEYPQNKWGTFYIYNSKGNYNG